ncbi:MaoC family dehydratase N-terminal domain-containing protein [Natrialbaceae archaeon GCM10025810]|uniref:FAS1-like dehydratase domain-containing protein n=1 Tax=Halovalidus salilacus TaxID=3075124 RepID=UPI00360A0666
MRTNRMDIDELEGQPLPDGTFTVESWKAFLWADATRNDEDAYRYPEQGEELGADGQLVPPSLCQHIAFEASGGIDETLGRVSDNWASGAALGGLRTDLYMPIIVNEPLQVSGEIASVEQKDGSSGQLSIITFDYEVTDSADEPVYDMEADLILLSQ